MQWMIASRVQLAHGLGRRFVLAGGQLRQHAADAPRRGQQEVAGAAGAVADAQGQQGGDLRLPHLLGRALAGRRDSAARASRSAMTGSRAESSVSLTSSRAV